MLRSFALPILALIVACAPAADPDDAPARGNPVLSANGVSLGTVDFPTSCNADAQTHLEHGLALVHHMNYVKGELVFAAAAEADPDCALAYWGQAMTYVHPLWPDTVPPARLAAGRAFLEDAANASGTSAREAGYVAALAGYYEGEERSERERLASYLDGFAALHAAHPDDQEAAVFHALALLANAAAEDKSYAKQTEAGEILRGVLAELPQHPGAHHYTIHAYDFPPLAERALDIARRYDDLAPENTHALHMTSHIFTRLGLWQESVEFNTRAADAAGERTPAGDVPMHRLHALDYLAYAHLQRADDAAADQVLEDLRALEPPFQNHSATAYAFAAVPARLALERHDWEAAATTPLRWPADLDWDPYPYLDAISYFARAMGAARTNRASEARSALTELERLESRAGELDIAYDWGIQVAIQRIAAEAWLAYESGDPDAGLELALRAAEMEATTEKNPVTPGEVLPARELYGDMLLASGRHAEAIAAYEAALERSPKRFNSLFGAGRAAELADEGDAARKFYRQLLEICVDGADRDELDHARRFLDGEPAA